MPVLGERSVHVRKLLANLPMRAVSFIRQLFIQMATAAHYLTLVRALGRSGTID